MTENARVTWAQCHRESWHRVSLACMPASLLDTFAYARDVQGHCRCRARDRCRRGGMVRRDLYSAHVTCGKNSGLAPGGDHQYTNFSRTIRPSFHSWIATWVLFTVPHSAWSMSTRQTTNALLPETT